MKKVLALLIISLISPGTNAEYRVYQYYARSKVQNINPPKAELVTSTLNPIAYAAYNGGSTSVEVTLLRSWMCMGNTSLEEVCTISDGAELSGENK